MTSKSLALAAERLQAIETRLDGLAVELADAQITLDTLAARCAALALRGDASLGEPQTRDQP